MSLYNITFELDDQYKVVDCEALLTFSKRDDEGLNRATLKKYISMKENYLLEEKMRNGNW